MSDEADTDEPIQLKKYRVTVTISSLGSERRKIDLGELEEDAAKRVIAMTDAAFDVVRRSNALMLSGTDGIAVFANLDNVAFVEVQIAE